MPSLDSEEINFTIVGIFFYLLPVAGVWMMYLLHDEDVNIILIIIVRDAAHFINLNEVNAVVKKYEESQTRKISLNLHGDPVCIIQYILLIEYKK